MKKWLWLILPALLLLLTVPVVRPAQAQDKTLVWDRYDVSITVQPNGDMLVEEMQEITFTSGTFRFGFAAIPLDRVENISDVEVLEISSGGAVRQYTPNSTAEYGFTTGVSDNELKITWYFPPTANRSHTYVLRYRVEGGLRIYPDGDQVWWKAIPPDHNFPIKHSTITVTPPQTFAKNELQVETYGHPHDTASYSDRGAVVITASNIPAGQEMEVRVQFPHGVVQAEAPAWQQSDDFYRAWGPVVSVVFGALGLLLFVGSPFAVYGLWYTRGRDIGDVVVPEYLSEPPDDLPAAVVGTLVDEHADVKDIVASILDLAERGAIRLVEKEKTGAFGASRDFEFHLVDESKAIYPHEKRLLKKIFSGDQSVRRMADLKQKFYSTIPGLKSDLYTEVVKAGLFPTNPESTRKRWTFLGGVLAVVSLGMACFLLVLLGQFSAAVICPGLGLLTGALALLAVGRHMPRKTAKGTEEAAKWLAFKKYLENIEKYGDLESAKEQFQRYLPYAMAFGLEKRLIRQFSAINAPAPTWWGPVLMPHPGGYYGMPYGPSGGGSGGPTGGPPGPLAGEGGGVPNLSDMSQGLGQSLSSMSSGLGALLNSAGSTLTSTPPPPKTSSSGGWGGGGWSGGGGFGGGGGGGGSRGFG